MPDTFDSLIDARIDAKLAAYYSSLESLADKYIALEARIGQLEFDVSDLDHRVFPPSPVPVEPTVKSRLIVRDGKFLLDRQPFTDFSANVAGNALVSTTRTERRDMFKRLQDVGCRLVRLHHVAKNVTDDGISEYQPTIAEWLAGLIYVQECLDDLADLGMLAWLSCFHRQRYADRDVLPPHIGEYLYGPRPAGIVRGEIHDGFFWFRHLESAVASFCDAIADRFGQHPGLGLLTIANEKLCVRSNGQWIGDRVLANKSPYQTAWFERLDEYQAATGKTDKDIDKPGVNEFHAWNGVQVFKRLYQRLREHGVMCPIGSSPLFGDCTMSALPEASALNFTDLHAYPSSVSSLPDPFLPNDMRTIQSIANACRVVGKPLCLSEYAGIHEGQKLRLPSFYQAPDAVARAGFDVSCYYAWNQGKPGNNGLYDAGDDAVFAERFISSSRYNSVQTEAAPYHLMDNELFGAKAPGTGYVPPPIPGTQPWARDVGGVLLPELGWM